MAHLTSGLVDFTLNAGGTVAFLDSFAQGVSPRASREFSLYNWGLDWTTGVSTTTIEENVCLNKMNELANGRRKKWLPTVLP